MNPSIHSAHEVLLSIYAKKKRNRKKRLRVIRTHFFFSYSRIIVYNELHVCNLSICLSSTVQKNQYTQRYLTRYCIKVNHFYKKRKLCLIIYSELLKNWMFIVRVQANFYYHDKLQSRLFNSINFFHRPSPAHS